MKQKIFLSLCLVLTSSLAAAADTREPSQKEALELLPVACQGQIRSSQSVSSCTHCPSYTNSPGLEEDFTLTKVIYGKFTDAKKTDALLDMEGCGYHFNNFGGSVLLRWQGLTEWKFTRYQAGYHSNDCFKYPARDGRDLLLCSWSFFNMGEEEAGFTLMDLLKNTSKSLFLVGSNLGACGEGASYSQEIMNIQQIKLNEDAFPDLRLEVETASNAKPKGWKCGDALIMGRKHRYTLEFLFNGVDFKRTKETQKIIEMLEQQNGTQGSG